MSQYNFEEEARAQRQKINYFNSKVGNKDFDKAIDHLIIADWDEKKAVEMYLRLNKKKNVPQNKLPSLNTKNNNNSQNPKSLAPLNNQKNNSQISQETFNCSKNNNSSRTEINITDEFLKNNIPYQNKDYQYFNDLFLYLQSKLILVEKSLDGFLKSLKEHPGIIILLNIKKIEELKKHIPEIINNFICPDINRIAVMFPIMFNSSIGDKLSKQFSCWNFPSYIFCKYESQKLIKVIGKMEGVFNLNLFIDNVLKSLPEAKSNLKASLKTSLKKSIMFNYNKDANEDDFNLLGQSEKKNNLESDINIKDSIFGLSDGSILQKREQEIKELEREQLEKMKKEEEKKKKIKDEENQIKKRIEDYEKEAEKSKQLLPEEPEENNPDVSQIILRYPDGEKTIERRFLKTEKINVLYLLVKSKGREIFFDQESNNFDLIYGFPPKNLDNSKNNTLEDEGLFPNAIIQIREKE
jgi:hypothetical protein